MIKTFLLLARRLPLDIAEIVHLFITPTLFSPEEIGKSGHFELCMLQDDLGEVLFGACSAGHFEIIDAILTKHPKVHIVTRDIDELSKWPYSLPLVGRMATDRNYLYETCIEIGMNHGDYGFSARYFLLLDQSDQNRILIKTTRDKNATLAKALIDALANA